MNKTCLKNAEIRMEYLPAHKYIGIWSDEANGYGDFWSKHNCNEVCGIIESMRPFYITLASALALAFNMSLHIMEPLLHN